MNFQNYTPYAAISWENIDCDNKEFVTSLARVKYDLVKNNKSNEYKLVLSKDQEDLFPTDIYFDEVGKSSMLIQNDFIDFKPTTDVIINARAYCPIKEGAKTWDTCVSIYDDNNKRFIQYPLAVKAESVLHKAGLIWTPTIRKKIKSVRMLYEKAYGGTIVNDEETNDENFVYMNDFNPVGCGAKKIKDKNSYIKDVEVLYIDEKRRNVPAGYGAIDNSWESRKCYLGTYDDAWLEKQHPLPPKDFDYYFNQAANPNLILKQYIQNNYKFEFENLKKDTKKFHFYLPKLDILTKLTTNIKDYYSFMNIDTVLINIDDEDESKHCVYVSYRAKIKNKFEIKQCIVFQNNQEVT